MNNKITQEARFRQSLLSYAEKHGVSTAARKYNVTRQYIYRWKKRYDGSINSLMNRSTRPHSHPNQHTGQELTLIRNMRKRNPHAGLVVFWVKLSLRGYSRSITGLYRMLKKIGAVPIKPPNPKYIPKPYEQMLYPGQRVQIDVKHVPAACIVGDAKSEGKKFYQFTAIDEYSRYRYLEAFEDNSSYSASIFLEHCISKLPFAIQCVQTDNGNEFTTRLRTEKSITLFQKTLQVYGIEHKMIRPFTPRHNGKVERSHRKDNEYFYAVNTFYSLEDLQKQLKRYNRGYNKFPMRPLKWQSPKKVLFDFLDLGVTYV